MDDRERAINDVIGRTWHEFLYPRPAVDEPTDKFKQAIREAFAAGEAYMNVYGQQAPGVDEEVIAAAQLRVALDAKRGLRTPEDIQRLADQKLTDKEV